MKNLMLLVMTLVAFSSQALVLEVPVASGTQDGYTTEQLAAIAGGTITEIQKTGDGTLVSKGIASFAGTIRVSGGVLKVSDATGLGTSAGVTVVESGASLWFDTLSSGYTTYKSEQYTVAGTGSTTVEAAQRGAIIITGATCQLSHLTLAADAKLYSALGFHLYDDGSSIMDMGGHDLSLETANSGTCDVEWKLDGVVNPGHVTITEARYFRPYTSLISGGASHELRLYGRTGILLDNTTTNQDWKILRYGTGGFYQIGSSGRWGGAVENANTASPMGISIGLGKELIIEGAITGAGSFAKDANLGSLILKGVNDFTGVFDAKGGKLILSRPESAAGSIADRFTFSNLTVAFGLVAKTENHPDGWTDAQFKSALDAINTAQKANVSVSLYTVFGDSHVTKATFAGEDYTPIRIGAIAAGESAIAPTTAAATKFRVSTDADFVFTKDLENDDPVLLGSSSVINGFWHFKDAGYVDLGTQKIDVGANRSSNLMGIKVSGNTVLGRADSGDGEIGLPYSTDLQQAYMEVSGGAIVTNRIQISVGSTQSAGAIYLRNGTVFSPYNATYLGWIGCRSDGYIEVSGGDYVVDRHLYLGTYATGAGQIGIKGGRFSVLNSSLYIGDVGFGLVHQTAGTATYGYDVIIAAGPFNNNLEGGYGAYTVDGASALTDCAGNVVVNGRAHGDGYLNVLNGGTVRTLTVKKTGAETGAQGYVYVNGGMIKLAADDPQLFYRVDKVTVGANGITIDTDGHNVTLVKPLDVPAAGGITSITLGSAFANVVLPPSVVITGDGLGASAVCEFDSVTRTVTGVKVTSPGSGYTAGNTTITAYYKGYPRQTVNCSFTLSEAAGSPVKLMKKGEGALTIPEGVLPAGSLLAVEAGSVSGAGATFAEYAADVEKAATGVFGTVPSWPAGAVLSIASLEQVDPEVSAYVLVAFSESAPSAVPTLAAGCILPDKWELRLRGNKLVLCQPKGSVVIIQ